MTSSRQLAAIMFTDIVGFTALMGNDEKKTFEILEKNRQIHKPIINKYNGRWIKELGDGVMASFETVSDAVNAAINILEACNTANEYQLCIGIHLAEVVFENNDVFGDGVNIAARIQSAAPPGCIFISESVYKNITNKKDINTYFVKEEKLKNVSHPVRLYQVLIEGSEKVVMDEPVTQSQEKSIAVLPFVNMSSDPEQEYFSDGISEEIINMLAQVHELKVIGRTSSFGFKGKNMDLKIIGDQLQVKYLLEGSVRKAGNKLRITAQLIEVSNGYHLYSEKFDRELVDVFAIQDEISLAILDAIKVRLLTSKKEAVLKNYTDNVEAYELYLKGRYHLNGYNKDAILKAIDYYKAAIDLDHNYAIAYSGLAQCYQSLWHWTWLPADQSLPFAIKYAHEAIRLDDEIAETNVALGRLYLHYEWKFEEAVQLFKRALEFNPNHVEANAQLTMVSAMLGRWEEAKYYSKKAISLDPVAPMTIFFASTAYLVDAENLKKASQRLIKLNNDLYIGHWFMGLAYSLTGKYEEAIRELKLAAELENAPTTLSQLGVVYGQIGDEKSAMQIIEKLKSIPGIENTGNKAIGDVYKSLGLMDKAFEYYFKGVERHEGQMTWVKVYNQIEPLKKKDPRFKELLQQIGLPLD